MQPFKLSRPDASRPCQLYTHLIHRQTLHHEVRTNHPPSWPCGPQPGLGRLIRGIPVDDLDFRAANIRLLCTDIDGVLTTGALHYGSETGHTKVFHVRDGAAIKWLQRSGIPVAFISGLASKATMDRARDLGIEDCFAGHLDKGPVLDQLRAKYGLGLDQIAHLGDDLPDLPLLRQVGLACCPADAVEEVQSACHWVTPVRGGQGVLRLVAERILKAQSHWDTILSTYEVRP
jgi:3-deoxy-D-manno-octulosonate 8-phosphate phosphatase (KDO 8-P phosphatase)